MPRAQRRKNPCAGIPIRDKKGAAMRRCRPLYFARWSGWAVLCWLLLLNHNDAMTQPVFDEAPLNLPKTFKEWKLSGEPRRITAKAIFDYMDGAGELYIGYRFKYLDVYEYAAAGEDQVLVELYWMESSDDAFGLLSGDWGGDPVVLGQNPAVEETPGAWPGRRALYGSGLLRIWSGNLYARIMAYQETAKSKAAVLGLARIATTGRESPDPPRLLLALPSGESAGFRLRTDRVCFFRSHLVLNSVYFLSTGNILGLGHSAEALAASYAPSAPDGGGRSAQLILVRYRDPEDARRGLASFGKTYLPEKHLSEEQLAPGGRNFWQVEDGWLGYSGKGRVVALVFECPSRDSAARLLEEALDKFDSLEAAHE